MESICFLCAADLSERNKEKASSFTAVFVLFKAVRNPGSVCVCVCDVVCAPPHYFNKPTVPADCCYKKRPQLCCEVNPPCPENWPKMKDAALGKDKVDTLGPP